MRRLANAPTKDQLDSPRVTDFFQTLEQRCNVYESSTDPTADQVPEGQWVFHKNTTTGLVRVWTNDDGTLKSVTLLDNMPVFSAYRSAAQSVTTSVYGKIQVNTVEYDTHSFFNTATNRFQPTIAGYYHFDGLVALVPGSPSGSFLIAALFKNGTISKRGPINYYFSTDGAFASVSADIFLNGSTDYVELFAYNSGPTMNTANYTNGSENRFSGFLLRT